MTINILPLLKSAEWARLAVEQNRLVSPLPVDGVEASSAAPVIAYGVDQADTVAFLPATESNLQRIAAIRDQSFAALRQRLACVGKRDRFIYGTASSRTTTANGG